MDMKVDKPGCQIVPIEVDNLLPRPSALRLQAQDLCFPNNDLETIANSIGENASPIDENHRSHALRPSVGRRPKLRGTRASEALNFRKYRHRPREIGW